MSIQTRARDLIEYMNTGRILEAMEEFYDESIEMRENGNPPTIGLAANIEREKQFLSQIKEWKSLDNSLRGFVEKSR